MSFQTLTRQFYAIAGEKVELDPTRKQEVVNRKWRNFGESEEERRRRPRHKSQKSYKRMDELIAVRDKN